MKYHIRQCQRSGIRVFNSGLLALIIVLAPVSAVLAAALAPDVDWQQTYGGASYDRAKTIELTADGGFIIAGETASYAVGGYDFYLVKTDAAGNSEWQRAFGGSNSEELYSVQPTADGGYILAGGTRSTEATLWDAYLVKTDASGNKEWENTYGGAGNEFAYTVRQTSDGGYVLAGYTSSYGAGGRDYYLVKVDASGSVEWEQVFGGAGAESARFVRQVADGGYILAGYSNSFSGSFNFYLVKTDPAGNLAWQEISTWVGGDEVIHIVPAADGGYILLGSQWSPAGAIDFSLIKTDATGNKEWENTFGASGDEYARSVALAADGGYLLSGQTTSFGAGEDMYLVKTDAAGDKEWEKVIGGAGDERAYAVRQTTDGGYILVGNTWSFGAGLEDACLVKLGPEVPDEPPVAIAGDPYLVRLGDSVVLDGSASYDSDGTIVGYDWSFGDNTTGSGVTVAHDYTTGGVYAVVLTVTDNNRLQSTTSTMVVVYDPDAGSATGGGWFWSVPGNLASNPESEGKATFGFVVRYRDSLADGNLEFQYRIGDINLRGSQITWLVVSSANAQFQGQGTINGEGWYTFRVLADDGDISGGQPDRITVKIWAGTDTESEPVYKVNNVEIGGGNIIVHSN